LLDDAARTRRQLADEPDRSAAVVQRKETALAALQSRAAPLGGWTRALDLWCGGWFWEESAPPDAGASADVTAHLLGRTSMLPERVAESIAASADALAAKHRFLHWPLAFPEVFAGSNPGFDAVLGNPPWDMVRGDSGSGNVRQGRRDDARRLSDFVREAGVYRVAAGAHVNRYQLFVERALQLTRRGGRVGLVLPSGAIADAGAGPLRRHLFDRAAIDRLTGLDNRLGIFPIHRSVRFVLLTGTVGPPTTAIGCRFGVTRAEDLQAHADRETERPLVLTRGLLSRLSGDDDLGIPELITARDLAIVEKIAATIPELGSAAGWNAQFGRELNATDDRVAFVPYAEGGAVRAVLEGKQIEPFRAHAERSRLALPLSSPLSARVPRRTRLAYRDVASATNRLTLIAALVPARCVTTHTLFVLKTPLSLDAQHVLCALLNSFVANYLIRLRVNTHVTAALMSRLRVPVVGERHPYCGRLLTLSRSLASVAGVTEVAPEYAELQALAARLYGLTREDFEHVVGRFPLIGDRVKREALAIFGDLH
jgi:hypothetical protein